MSSNKTNSKGATNTDDSTTDTAHKPIITTTNTYSSNVGAGGSDGGNASAASPALNAEIRDKSSDKK